MQEIAASGKALPTMTSSPSLPVIASEFTSAAIPYIKPVKIRVQIYVVRVFFCRSVT